IMRRFSSEGSLLDLDFLPWKKVNLKNADEPRNRNSGTYTLHEYSDEPDCARTGCFPPLIREPGGKRELTKERSISTENLDDIKKDSKNRLSVCVISEGCRAYSDGQLAPTANGSTESIEKEEPSTSPTDPTCSTNPSKSQRKAKLHAAKLHLKSLFGGQVNSPHSSHSNLFNPEHKESVEERRSRLLFMRQWSQMGHSRKSKISREELEHWSQSLTALLSSPTGVSVFGAFLRSEFSEENLQFYLACEQYKHSSNNFSLHRRGRDIYNTYILPGSPREVNLDSKTRDLTIQLLQAPSHTSLNMAQKRIYSLLDTDCYPRFLQSPLYTTLLQDSQ
uniref:RGS domain-containing protein n=1 Tax=Periophthalmus magnuspinnatus TaxID=409849 RepID=A0A3B4B7N5_9GOBI